MFFLRSRTGSGHGHKLATTVASIGPSWVVFCVGLMVFEAVYCAVWWGAKSYSYATGLGWPLPWPSPAAGPANVLLA